MEYKVYTSITDVASEWDQFLPEFHSLRSVHLRVLEESQPDDLTFYYVVFHNTESEIIALAYFQLLHFQSKHYAAPVAKNFALRALERGLMRKGYHMLVCGNLLRIDAPGLYYDDEQTSASEIFYRLDDFIRDLSPSPVAVLIKDWDYPNDLEWVKNSNYLPWRGDLTMKMDIRKDWKTFDDYIKSLRHRYSQRVRKTRKKLEGLVRRELSPEEINTCSPRIFRLYQNVLLNQSIRLIIVNENYFRTMKRQFGDDFRLFGYLSGEELVGFSSNLMHNSTWELHLIGMDYQYNHEHWLYFNILFDAIADAIQAGKKELEMGRTARRAKAAVGGTPIYFNNYVKLKGPVIRTITKILRGRFVASSETNWQELNPFK